MDYTFGSNEIHILVYIYENCMLISYPKIGMQLLFLYLHIEVNLYEILCIPFIKTFLRSYFYEVYMEEACKHAI